MPKMRRLTSYIAGSAALATGVVTWAFYERPNFYSAVVYLSQSNACLMVLTNLALIIGCSFMYGMQQLLFGPLRPIEIEQLYERSWFAVTEWLFAMSTFRDEFGPLFLLMFSGLFVGKVWGWIAEGRIEMLEQQPPANPRLFHTRLIASLALYVVLAMRVTWYCLDAVISEAKPGVMVMFVFEFAIILISALSASIRYGFWAAEQEIVKRQVKERVEVQRVALRQAREQAREQAQAEGNTEAAEVVDAEDAINEDDIEVPGWENKGAWLFGLDIGTDFLKLVAYMAFFTILTVFYGIPIYIIRDMYITVRSFTKRVADYAKYQRATRDMHRRYPDATSEELASDNTCIVCREDMQPWQQVGAQAPAVQAVPERQRPKKLPCGHILHFGCLRSWLERQQVCPICRRSVLSDPIAARNVHPPGEQQQQQPAAQPAAAADLIGDLFGPPVVNGENQNDPQLPPANENPPQNPQNPPQVPAQVPHQPQYPQPRMRRFRFGPLRFEFGYAAVPAQPTNNDNIRQLLEQMQQVRRNAEALGDAIRNPTPAMQAMLHEEGGSTNNANLDPAIVSLRQGFNIGLAQLQLNQYDEYLRREFQTLDATRHRVEVTRQLFRELERSRAQMESLQQHERHAQAQAFPAAFAAAPGGVPAMVMNNQPFGAAPGMVFGQTPWGGPPMAFGRSAAGGPVLGVQQLPFLNPQQFVQNLPEGMTLPPGYQIVPLAPTAAAMQLPGQQQSFPTPPNGVPVPTPTVSINQGPIVTTFTVNNEAESDPATAPATSVLPQGNPPREDGPQAESEVVAPRISGQSPPPEEPQAPAAAAGIPPPSSFTSGADWSFPRENGSAHHDEASAIANGSEVRHREAGKAQQARVEDAEEEE